MTETQIICSHRFHFTHAASGVRYGVTGAGERDERTDKCQLRNPESTTGTVESARVLGSDAARAVGRFNPEGPSGYRAKSLPDGPLRATRAEAEQDEAIHHEERVDA